jgi:hypothetical protein
VRFATKVVLTVSESHASLMFCQCLFNVHWSGYWGVKG